MKIITPKPNWREGLVATEVDEATGEFDFAGKRYRLESNAGAFAIHQRKSGNWVQIGGVISSPFCASCGVAAWTALLYCAESKVCTSEKSPFDAVLKALVRI